MIKILYPCHLATSWFGRIRGTILGLLKPIGPPPPALGHPGNRKQPFDSIAITGVDAKYLSDGEIMIGSLDYPDLISATHIALDGGSCRGLKSGEAPCRRRLLSARSCIRGFDLDIKLARVRAAICGR